MPSDVYFIPVKKSEWAIRRESESESKCDERFIELVYWCEFEFECIKWICWTSVLHIQLAVSR